jgi:putative DNA primase/helicase
MLVGEGSNGKSTLIKTLITLLGKENCSNRSLQELTSDRFAKADLNNKMANFFLDLPAKKILDSGDFKILVSGDRISAQKKHQQPFAFENHAKLVFSANQIPEVEDKSYAYYRRWVIIPFNRTFEGEEKDEHLIDKLTTEQELSGILNLALKGLRKLYSERGFKDIDISEIRRQYETGASRIKSFIDQKCILGSGNESLFVESTRLREAYRKYCREQGTSFFDEKRFGEELKTLGVAHRQKREGGKRPYYELGIALKDGRLNVLDKTATTLVYGELSNIQGKVEADSSKTKSQEGPI